MDSINQSLSFSTKDINQDFVLCKHYIDKNVYVLADGIGSYVGSEEASKLACLRMAQYCDQELDIYNYPQLYSKVTESLHNELLSNDTDDPIKNKFGTTLMTCIETVDSFEFSYVGNGSILQFRGDALFSDRSSRDPIPYTCLLNPHSRQENGRNKLTRFLSPYSTKLQITPTILEVKKDKIGSGDIIILCSDGIYSQDEVRTASSNKGALSVLYEEILVLLVDILFKFGTGKSFNQELLEYHLSVFKEIALARNLVHDDTTLVVILTDQVITYLKSKLGNE